MVVDRLGQFSQTHAILRLEPALVEQAVQQQCQDLLLGGQHKGRAAAHAMLQAARRQIGAQRRDRPAVRQLGQHIELDPVVGALVVANEEMVRRLPPARQRHKACLFERAPQLAELRGGDQQIHIAVDRAIEQLLRAAQQRIADPGLVECRKDSRQQGAELCGLRLTNRRRHHLVLPTTSIVPL